MEGTYGEKHVEDVCDIHLLFLAKDTIAELKQRTTGASVPPEKPSNVPQITKPLGLHNMDLPDVETPELSANLEVPTTNTGDYVTSLGMVIPLPEKDLEIAPELLQRDPDITELEEPETERNNVEITTLPCSIHVRQLDQQDINMWQLQRARMTIPDATKNSMPTDDGKNSKYNLRLRKPIVVNNRPHSERPHREAAKSVNYTEPTDESSQDSQVIGTIYLVDNRPIPDDKLEKIMGLSEPSAYRLGAQSYIDSKKRGELPQPPKQMLPGFKAKPDTEPEN